MKTTLPRRTFIAAVALRMVMPVLHRDRDFEVLRAHCGVPTVSLL